MIRLALAFLGVSAGAAGAQALVATAPLIETCGGTEIVLEAVDDVSPAELEAASDVASGRVGGFFSPLFDYSDVVEGQVVVSVPGGMAQARPDFAGLFARVGLGFHPVVQTVETGADVELADGQAMLADRLDPVARYVVEATPILTGADVVFAQPQFDDLGQPAVGFEFSDTAAEVFGTFTSNNIGQPFAIVMEGEVALAPIIQDAIWGGRGIITGTSSIEDAATLAAVLQGGVLPFDLEIVEERRVDGSDPSADFCP